MSRNATRAMIDVEVGTPKSRRPGEKPCLTQRPEPHTLHKLGSDNERFGHFVSNTASDLDLTFLYVDGATLRAEEKKASLLRPLNILPASCCAPQTPTPPRTAGQIPALLTPSSVRGPGERHAASQSNTNAAVLLQHPPSLCCITVIVSNAVCKAFLSSLRNCG